MPLVFDGGETLVDDYLREMWPLFLPPPRTFQRTGIPASSTCVSPREEVPVGAASGLQGVGRGRVPGLIARQPAVIFTK